MAGKILIVDDVATNRIVLKVKLAAAHYQTMQSGSAAEALAAAARDRPDLILLPCELPDMPGIAACRAFKAVPDLAGIPIVMITGCADAEHRLAGLDAGAEDVFAKPLDEMVLLAKIRSLLRARETSEQLALRDGTYRELGFAEPAPAFVGPAKVGLVVNRLEDALHLKRDLQQLLPHRLLILTRDAALSEQNIDDIPDVFLVPACLTRPGDGLLLISELRSRMPTRHCGICLIMPADQRDIQATALDLGANEVIDADAAPREMAMRIQAQIQQKQRADRLRDRLADGLRLAMHDPLTGLYNRRYAMPHLAQIAAHARENGRQYAVMIIDLDRFKQVNDTFGHAGGDAVLIEVANRLRANLRPSDLLARVGGEEFLAVLPDSNCQAAHATAERLRCAIADHPFMLKCGATLTVTLSVGLTLGGGLELDGQAAEVVVARADKALLSAKADGRNQVIVLRNAA